jgi:hypothetical protein
MSRQRTVTIAGREVTQEDALRFEVVRAVLTGTMSLVQGANKLHMPMLALSRLVNGARSAIIRARGEDALADVRAEASAQAALARP